jgi:hypothetical protein
MRSCRRPGDLPGTSGSREILAGAGKEKELLAKKASSEKEHAAGSSLADEVGRLNAELARLHAILRDHGIEPGNDAA